MLGVLGAPCHGQQPNIVLLISDDAGFADWGFMDAYTSTVNPGQLASPVPTPSLDALRRRGVLLTNAYTASVCSPSRAAIVTGSYQQRIGYEYNINNRTSATAAPDGLTPETVTIFDRMKSLGYLTGVVGKWHLGAMADDGPAPGNRPPRQGVDEFFGIWKGSRNYGVGSVNGAGTLRETVLNPDGTITDAVLEARAPWQGMNVTNAFGQGAVDFIARHYEDAEPFFLYVSFTAPHSPIHPSPDFDDPRLAGLSGKRKEYASMVLTMDKEIGRILEKLDDPAGDGSVSLTEDTLVLFLNDNGGASGNGTVNTPLRGWKGSPYEGGTRVPIIVAGAGVSAAPGATYDKPVHSIDLLPTCYEAGQGSRLSDLDGVNLLPFLNGSNPGVPHGFIFLRHEAQVGIRTESWKLVKNGRGRPFELYDLRNDPGEGSDLAAANANFLAELKGELTKFEAGAQKPRHSKLGAGADTINYNDRFVFAPDGGGAPVSTGPNVLRNPGFEDGVQADGDVRYSFAELHDWTNDGDAASLEVAAINNDSHSGVYRGVFVTARRVPFQLTSHVIEGGETMLLDFWHKGKSGWDAGDTIEVELFYLEGGNVVVLSSLIVNPQASGYLNTVHLFPAFTDHEAAGKALGIRFLSHGGDSEFVSIDDVMLSTGRIGDDQSAQNWSELNAWIDPGTAASLTLRDLDSFPGCVLEFPVRDTHSYLATNDLCRPTELEFILNQLVLSGTFSGAASQTALIGGHALLLTNDLSGNPPVIEIAASGVGFSYEISCPLVLFDDLEIRGDGDAEIEISSELSDYLEGRGLSKSGSSTVRLSGILSYSGTTTVRGGTLLFDTPGVASSHLDVTAGTVGGVTTLAGGLDVAGTLAPGFPTGTFAVAGDVSLGGILAIDLNGATHDRLEVAQSLDLSGATLAVVTLPGGTSEVAYVIASYGSRSGVFETVSGIPAGYRLIYDYDDGNTSNNIAIVQATPTPYDLWVAASNLSGPEAALEADPNGDRVSNGIAFVLGSASALEDSSALLPIAVLKGACYEFIFRRVDQASALRAVVQYGTGLDSWASAVDGEKGITIMVTDDHFGPGTDRVVVAIPTALAVEGALFARLVVTIE